jgi:hypothetical protein
VVDGPGGENGRGDKAGEAKAGVEVGREGNKNEEARKFERRIEKGDGVKS